jgi:2,3-bisphosphoglycerate-independent phosphoglycerate mutase
VLPKLGERFGLTGAVISAVDLVRGLGRLAGLEVILVEGATGYLDTNYAGKVAAAARALETRDLVYLHVEAPDEASHEGSLEKKLRAIEDFDTKVVGEVALLRDRFPKLRMLVLPDHATLLATRTHDPTPVPFVVSGYGISADLSAAYCERTAPQTAAYRGTALFAAFLGRANEGAPDPFAT